MSSRTPRQFFKPLAIGAPAPLRELPVKLERMIHFVPGHNEKVRSKTPEMAAKVDVILANLEDAIPADAKIQARAGAIEMASMVDWKKLGTGLWTRVNPLNSPWFLDDVTEIVTKAGNVYDVIMLPKVEGPWDIHYADQLVAQLEAKAGITRPILFHAILETGQGVALRRGNLCRLSAHAGHLAWTGRPRRQPRNEDDTRRRRPPDVQGDRGSG